MAKRDTSGVATSMAMRGRLVPVDDEIVACINELRIAGESDDQVVWRMMREAFSERVDK